MQACLCINSLSTLKAGSYGAGPVIALAMGEKGMVSRVLAPKHGDSSRLVRYQQTKPALLVSRCSQN